MSDSEKTVKILVEADIKAFQKQMRDAGTSTKDLQKMATRFRKDGTKGGKDLQKIANTVNKGQKAAIEKAIKLEKQLQTQIDNTIKKMKEKADASKGNVKAIEEEVKALKELEAQMADSKSLRHGLGHRTLGERARAAAPGMRAGMGTAASYAGRGLAAAGFFVGSALFARGREAYGAAEQYDITQGGLTGLGRRRDFSPHGGARFGYSSTDTAAQAGAAARATGNLGSVTQAQALSRALGMDMGAATGVMGQLRGTGLKFSGTNGQGGGGADQLKKIIAAGFESGLERARVPEFIEGVGELVSTAQRQFATGVKSDGYASLLALLGRSGQPGLQGSAGVGVAAQLDQAIKNPGGGDAGRAVMLQALGFGTPGGNTSYYDAIQQQEKGAMDPQNVMKLFQSTGSRFGQGQQQILALKEMTGLSTNQLEGVRSSLNNGNSAEALEKIKAAMEASKPVEEQGLDQMKEMGAALVRIADQSDILVDEGHEILPSIQKIVDIERDLMEKIFPILSDTLPTIARGVGALATMVASLAGFEDPAVTAQHEAALNAGGSSDLTGQSTDQLLQTRQQITDMSNQIGTTMDRTLAERVVDSWGDFAGASFDALTGGPGLREGVQQRGRQHAADHASGATIQQEAQRDLSEILRRIDSTLRERGVAPSSDRVTTSYMTSAGAHAPPTDRPTHGGRTVY